MEHTPSQKEREDLWLDIGPAGEYEGLDCCERARREGDASPDGRAHGFEGAEPGPEKKKAPQGEEGRVPPMTPRLRALEWLDGQDPEKAPPPDR